MNVTAYIPCFNGARYLSQTIDAILRQTRPPDELLVIDDGSTDDSVATAQKFPVRVIHHKENSGLAVARNTALANARFPLLAAFDVDAVPEPTWLSYLLEAFADETIAGVGGRLIENFHDTPPDLWRALQLSQDLGEQPIEMRWPTPKRLGGFGTVFRTDVLKAVKGYDERYRTNYEDVDLCMRVLQAGYKTLFDPRAVMRHMRRDNFSSVLRTSWRWDFYTHYFNAGYNNTGLKMLFNFRWARVLMVQHVRAGHWALLPIDAALPLVHCYQDWLYRFSKGRLPPVTPDPESQVYRLYFPWPLRSFRRH